MLGIITYPVRLLFCCCVPPSPAALLLQQRNMRTFEMGYLELPATEEHQNEACLELIASSAPGVPVFDNLSNLRFTLTGGKRSWEGWVDKGVTMESSRTGDDKRRGKPAAAPTAAQRRPAAGGNNNKNNNKPAPAPAKPAAAGSGRSDTKRATSLQMSNPVYAVDYLAQDSVIDTWEQMQQTEDLHKHLRATPAMKQAERDAVQYAALRARYNNAKESANVASQKMTPAERAWQSVRKQYLWPDGQQGVMESLFSPYESEGIYTCAACQPDV
jgi:hypothetical protein